MIPVHITYAQMPLTNIHADVHCTVHVFSKIRSLNFGQSLRLHPYFQVCQQQRLYREPGRNYHLRCEAISTEISCIGQFVLNYQGLRTHKHKHLCSIWIKESTCTFLHFFRQNHLFKKTLSGILSECQTVWIQIRPDIFGPDLGLNCLQRSSADYLLAGKKFIFLRLVTTGMRTASHFQSGKYVC